VTHPWEAYYKSVGTSVPSKPQTEPTCTRCHRPKTALFYTNSCSHCENPPKGLFYVGFIFCKEKVPKHPVLLFPKPQDVIDSHSIPFIYDVQLTEVRAVLAYNPVPWILFEGTKVRRSEAKYTIRHDHRFPHNSGPTVFLAPSQVSLDSPDRVFL